MLIFIKKNFFRVIRKKCCLCCLIAPQSRINSGFLQGNKSPKSVALLLPCVALFKKLPYYIFIWFWWHTLPPVLRLKVGGFLPIQGKFQFRWVENSWRNFLFKAHKATEFFYSRQIRQHKATTRHQKNKGVAL